MTRTTYDDDKRYSGELPAAGLSEFETDIRCACASNAPVLITAPTDVALATASRIHRDSTHPGTLLTVDCTRTRLPEQLEAVFECAAPRGTIFLLHIDRLAPALQSLLFFRMASAGVRIIAATSVNLVRAAAEGTFDERLFYRLNQIHVVAP